MWPFATDADADDHASASGAKRLKLPVRTEDPQEYTISSSAGGSRSANDAEHGVWQSNANVLTSIEPPYDPAMGTYQLRALLCRIAKAEAEAA